VTLPFLPEAFNSTADVDVLKNAAEIDISNSNKKV